MGKLTLLAGGAIGYVLGTRAGRERYEEIRTRAQGLWEHPKVQEQANKAQFLAKKKTSEVQDKVQDKTSGGSSNGTSTDAYPSSPSVAVDTAGSAETLEPLTGQDTLGDPLRDPLSDPLSDPLDPSPPSSTGTSGTSGTTGLA